MKSPRSRRIWPVNAWPVADRELWERAQDGPLAPKLPPIRLAKIAEGYGRWLSILAVHEHFDETMHPADRVTRESVGGYVGALRKTVCKSTINNRLWQLKAAMWIMAPERSFAWLSLRHFRLDRAAPAPASAEQKLAAWPESDRQLWLAGT